LSRHPAASFTAALPSMASAAFFSAAFCRVHARRAMVARACFC
jgi:hypothetical protein